MLEILFLTDNLELKQTTKCYITINDLITKTYNKSLNGCTIYETDSEYVPIKIIPSILLITSKLKYILIDYNRRTIGSYLTIHQKNIHVHPSEYFAYQHAIATATGVKRHYPNPKQYFIELKRSDIAIQPIKDVQHPEYDRLLYTKKRTYCCITLKWRNDDHFFVPWNENIFCTICKECIMYYCGTCKQLSCSDSEYCSANLCCRPLDLNCMTCRNNMCKPDDKLCRSCKNHTCSTCFNEDDLCGTCYDDISWLVNDTESISLNLFKSKKIAYEFALHGLIKQLSDLGIIYVAGTDTKYEYDYLKQNYNFRYSYEIEEIIQEQYDNKMTS
jgi:hypothetical protein